MHEGMRMVAMLAAKRWVASEVNLRHLSCAGKEAHKQGIYSGIKTQGRRHQKSKTGVSVPPLPKKGLMSSKKFLKKLIHELILVLSTTSLIKSQELLFYQK